MKDKPVDEKKMARVFGLALGGLFTIGLVLNALTMAGQ